MAADPKRVARLERRFDKRVSLSMPSSVVVDGVRHMVSDGWLDGGLNGGWRVRTPCGLTVDAAKGGRRWTWCAHCKNYCLLSEPPK